MPLRAGLIVLLLSTVSLAGEPQRWDVEDMTPKGTALRKALAFRHAVTAKATKSITVDCAKGDRIQNAVDGRASPMIIEVRGICVENVIIDKKDVTLRGASPLTDGVQGAPGSTAPAIEIRYSSASRLENLSASGGPANGMTASFSTVTMLNCRFVGNRGTGVRASEGTFIEGTELTLSQNLLGMYVLRGAAFFCVGCRLENNTFVAARASTGAILSVLDSVVSGRNGIQTVGEGSYADIDCLTLTTSYPCSLNVTGRAAGAFGGSQTALWGAGSFTGALEAFDRGNVLVYGAQQMATGQPGQGPPANVAGSLAYISVEPSYDNGLLNSRLLGAEVHEFGRLIMRDVSSLAGPVNCSSAGDAWLDPTITVEPGASVSNCEHATLPAP